jgi:hypothetical protein
VASSAASRPRDAVIREIAEELDAELANTR